ncbi:MAG: hypothetical protein JNK82_13490 [Myxococcaceae bacterium]|nr:hypothetical protein [Myxococcaceae bacterium]
MSAAELAGGKSTLVMPGDQLKIAEALLAHIEQNHKVAYAALVAGGAGGAAYIAYTKGSAGLNAQGVPTSANGTVKGFDLKLGTTFESGFDNLKVSGGAGRSFGKYGKVSVDATGSADGFEKGSASYKVGDETSASVGVTANEDGVETVSGGVTVKAGRVTVGANRSHNVQNGNSSGSASVNVQVRPNVRAGVSANGSVAAAASAQEPAGKKKVSVTGDVTVTTKRTDIVVSGRAGPDEKYVGVGVKVDLDRGSTPKKVAPKKGPSVNEDVMGRAQAAGAKAVNASELRPKEMPAGNEIEPGALAGELASRVADAVKAGTTSIELSLPEDYQKLGAAERKQIAAAVAKIARAAAGEVPGGGDIASIKVNFGGKTNEYVSLRE